MLRYFFRKQPAKKVDLQKTAYIGFKRLFRTVEKPMFCYSEFHFYFTPKVKTIKTITILSILLYDCKCEMQHFLKINFQCSQVSTKPPVSA